MQRVYTAGWPVPYGGRSRARAGSPIRATSPRRESLTSFDRENQAVSIPRQTRQDLRPARLPLRLARGYHNWRSLLLHLSLSLFPSFDLLWYQRNYPENRCAYWTSLISLWSGKFRNFPIAHPNLLPLNRKRFFGDVCSYTLCIPIPLRILTLRVGKYVQNILSKGVKKIVTILLVSLYH